MINVFYHVDASAFLIPSRFVERPFTDNEPSFDLITEWAEKLETSLTATAFRFARFTSEPVAIVYSVSWCYPIFSTVGGVCGTRSFS